MAVSYFYNDIFIVTPSRTTSPAPTSVSAAERHARCLAFDDHTSHTQNVSLSSTGMKGPACNGAGDTTNNGRNVDSRGRGRGTGSGVGGVNVDEWEVRW